MSETSNARIDTTVGTMLHNYNEISDHITTEGGDVEEGHTLYPLTKEQLKIIKENLPNDSDDEETRAKKSMKVKEQKSTIFDRIKARFSEEYLEHTVALLGYNIGSNKLSKVTDKFEIKQILNHIFKANITKNAKLFSMEKFRHRPIFCGVNVMYDPTASEEFNTMQHTDEYLKGDWKDEYNNALVYFNKAKDIQEKILPSDSLDLASLYFILGTCYMQTQDFGNALIYFEKSLVGLEKHDKASVEQVKSYIDLLKSIVQQE